MTHAVRIMFHYLLKSDSKLDHYRFVGDYIEKTGIIIVYTTASVVVEIDVVVAVSVIGVGDGAIYRFK